MKSVTSAIVAIFFMFGTISCAYGAGVRLDGRVFETSSNRGLASLTVKLTPPKTSKLPVKITTTNERGEFRFIAIDRGRYVIEVYQGLTILYRNVVDVNQDTRKEIPIRRLR